MSEDVQIIEREPSDDLESIRAQLMSPQRRAKFTSIVDKAMDEAEKRLVGKKGLTNSLLVELVKLNAQHERDVADVMLKLEKLRLSRLQLQLDHQRLEIERLRLEDLRENSASRQAVSDATRATLESRQRLTDAQAALAEAKIAEIRKRRDEIDAEEARKLAESDPDKAKSLFAGIAQARADLPDGELKRLEKEHLGLGQ